MLAKTFLVVFLATLTVSLAKEDAENEIVVASLNTGTNLLREFSKIVSEDDKYSLDLNALYKKYEIAKKAEQVKSDLLSQLKKAGELTVEYLKKTDIETEEQLKKYIDIIKKEDAVLADKLTKFNEKSTELDRITEDIVKYLLDTDKLNVAIEKVKAVIHPIEHKIAESIKKFETIVLEHLPKKNKGKK